MSKEQGEKLHSTNYSNTFIAVADDCPATHGEVPPRKGEQQTIATMQFDMVYHNPYAFTSDDVVFGVYASRNTIPESEHAEARKQFFSKGQPCLRASPLAKRYGWGIHAKSDGTIALYGCHTEEYHQLLADPLVAVVKAVKSKR